MKRALALLVLASACSRTRPFDTRAIYDAPKTGFHAIIDAKGIVPPGEDLGAAPITVLICSRTGHELRLDVPAYSTHARTAVANDGTKTSSIAWGAKSSTPSLTRALIDAGYVVDPAEVEETVLVIEGVGYGPKGTYMPGQPHALSVVSVDFDKPAAPARCAP